MWYVAFYLATTVNCFCVLSASLHVLFHNCILPEKAIVSSPPSVFVNHEYLRLHEFILHTPWVILKGPVNFC